ncbi:hypothetical protein CJF30_00006499 [Rutstroemia sp. NJR-2017a BBW]|nr:hypothetical protein CJF30_00006499 [Rutstroemia sp. NJR-2017a BBW]
MSEPMDLDAGVEAPRGTKRKAEDLDPQVTAPRRIKALDPNVVNKIAAGEIIVAPVHALKELIENAVDAGSTSLEVLVKDGGLKLLQITDNGHGINGVAFSCKKHGEASTTISTQAASSTGGHPFTYLNLEIEPHRLDVNVHPTKREVNFLNEDEIIEKICSDIRLKLADVDKSRNFMTQTLLPGAAPLVADTQNPDTARSAEKPRTTTRPYENNLVRTDAKLRKITSMLPPSASKPTGTQDSTPAASGTTAGSNSQDMEYSHSDREPITCRLMTVKELRGEVRSSMHNELTEIFATHTFVGIVDERRRLAAIQAGVKLFLVDYGAVSNSFFYQVGLTDFGNFGAIRFSPPLSLTYLLTLAAEHEKATAPPDTPPEDDFEVEEVVETIAEQLISRREMLLEYFSLSISESGDLESIPLLLKNYTPSLAKLPQFLLRLGPHVDWTSEKECFETFLRELASFYAPEQLPPVPGPEEEESESVTEEIRQRRDEVRKAVEDVLFPAFRQRLIATRELIGGAVLEVANLKGLYRVFERC